MEEERREAAREAQHRRVHDAEMDEIANPSSLLETEPLEALLEKVRNTAQEMHSEASGLQKKAEEELAPPSSFLESPERTEAKLKEEDEEEFEKINKMMKGEHDFDRDYDAERLFSKDEIAKAKREARRMTNRIKNSIAKGADELHAEINHEVETMNDQWRKWDPVHGPPDASESGTQKLQSMAPHFDLSFAQTGARETPHTPLEMLDESKHNMNDL